jgi:SAM-dependent methyltransferase
LGLLHTEQLDLYRSIIYISILIFYYYQFIIYLLTVTQILDSDGGDRPFLVDMYNTTMAATGTAPSNNNAPNIVRRRDKRRHFSQNALDLRDCFEYVSLAIRFDESRPESEQLLQTPLEDGRLYDNTMPFTQALEYLKKNTAPPARLATSTAHKRKLKATSSSSSPIISSSSTLAAAGQQSQQPQQHQQPQPQQLSSQQQQQQTEQKNQPKLPPVALTPIILSGLLAAIKDEQDAASTTNSDNANSNNNTDTNTNGRKQLHQQHQDTCSELVMYCLSMRRAALHRVRARRKRHRIQRIVLPVGSLLLLWAMMSRNLYLYMQQLQQLSLVESCDAKGKYMPACRMAEGHLHNKYRAYMLHLREAKQEAVAANRTFACPGEDCWHEALDEISAEAPFVLHTALRQDLITLQEVDAPHPSTRADRTGYHDGRPQNRNTPAKAVDKNQLKWLGDTTVNRLVREALEEYMPQTGLQRRILDVGCGVAGTFFALYKPPPPLSKNERARAAVNYKTRLVYTGITVSRAEAEMARELILLHGITNLKDVSIDVRSFDDPLPRGFTATIAIESLSYSRHFAATLNNLIEATVAGGILIVVDDVVVDHSRRRNRLAAGQELRHSLLTHKEWMFAFDKIGCEVVLMRDLSLEYELLGDPRLRPETAADASSWDWLIPYWLLGNLMKRSGNAAVRRVAEMHEDRAAAVEAYAARRLAYRETNMGYHMYVCRKMRIDF